MLIRSIEIWPVDVALAEPFVTARGGVTVAENLFVRLSLASGATGHGEIAPFRELSGEYRTRSQQAATELSGALLGQPVVEFRRLSRRMREICPGDPAARCGLETAMLDAMTRAMGVPLWALWGGADVREREIDITIPICALERTIELARKWHGRGFRTFKMKVGQDVEEDIRRIEAAHQAIPGIDFVIDANQGYTESAARHFIESTMRGGCAIRVMEQPVDREDIQAMAALKRSNLVPIVADESVFTLEDLTILLAADAADIVNIKITKSGVIEAAEIAAVARASGLGLMIGGMVETRIAMGCSWSLVHGLGGFDVLDLDTPLLVAADPVQGEYDYRGAHVSPWRSPGSGVEPIEGPREPAVRIC